MMDAHEILKVLSHSIRNIENYVNSGFSGPFMNEDIKNILSYINELSFSIRKKNEKLYVALQNIRSNLFRGAGFINLYSLGCLSQLLSIGIFTDEEQGIWKHMHPRLTELCKRKFEDGHYADAVRTAVVEIVDITKTVRLEIDGKSFKSEVDLMRNTFSKDGSALKLNSLSNIHEENIQEGYSWLFAGAVQAIRHPNSHKNIQLSEGDAVRKLMFASDLMYNLDEALHLYEEGR